MIVLSKWCWDFQCMVSAVDIMVMKPKLIDLFSNPFPFGMLIWSSTYMFHYSWLAMRSHCYPWLWKSTTWLRVVMRNPKKEDETWYMIFLGIEVFSFCVFSSYYSSFFRSTVDIYVRISWREKIMLIVYAIFFLSLVVLIPQYWHRFAKRVFLLLVVVNVSARCTLLSFSFSSINHSLQTQIIRSETSSLESDQSATEHISFSSLLHSIFFWNHFEW